MIGLSSEIGSKSQEPEILHIYGGAKLMGLEASNTFALILEDTPDLMAKLSMRDIFSKLQEEISRKAIVRERITEVIYPKSLCRLAETKFRKEAAKFFPNANFAKFKPTPRLDKAYLPAGFIDFLDAED